MSLIGNIRLDVGDDDSIVPSSGTIQSAGTTRGLLDSIRVDVADDTVYTLIDNYPNFRMATEGGPVTVLTTDNVIFINKTVAEPTSVILPASLRVGHTLTIKDFRGDASTNQITIFGTIDGQPQLTLNSNYGSYDLVYAGSNQYGLV